LTVNDYTKTVLYPSATSNAFAYDGGYVIKAIIENGAGYWMKFSGAQSVPVTGLLRTSENVGVKSGWNLVGSIGTELAATSITSNPPGMITGNFFGYSGTYAIADTIRPGSAYWVKVQGDGVLTLSSSSISPSSRIKIIATSELPPSPPDASAEGRQLSNIPKEFALEQNYPNPFNPSTVIRYQLPVANHVALKIYDVLGQEVATLVDEIQDAGYKSATWDASTLPSGLYFYKLTAGTFSEVRKLMLVK
jgi:hypothetical protein